MTIGDELSDLAVLRRQRGVIEARMHFAQAALEATHPYREIEALKRERGELLRQEAVVAERAKSLALAQYEASGDKRPEPGVAIRVYRRPVYDMATVIAWCKAQAPAFVREVLDAKAFEKVALELPGAPVEAVSEARAFVDQDLSGWLHEEAS